MVVVPEIIAGRRLTFEDYQALPNDQDYEIIDGALHVAPRPRPRHQIIAHRVAFTLTAHTHRANMGVVVPDADLVVDERDAYVSPDIMFFAGDRFSAVEPDGWIRVIPDLVVEVLSPGTEEYDRTQKRELYARLGVPHYWMADPRARTLAECVLQPDGVYGERTVDMNTPFQPAIFPELVIDLAQIFE